MVRITYVWHDCFVVETESAVLVFDYWLDVGGRSSTVPGVLRSAGTDKPIYVLVSHGHKDHYNPSVFLWASEFRDVRYVVSRDVMKRIRHVVSETSVYSGPKVDPGRVTALRPGECFSAGGVVIAAFRSTDIGNSYVVEADGRRFFHAGDLNAWIWKDESTESEISEALKTYESILDKIVSKYPEFDMAMFPVDSRLGTDYFTGAKIFLEKICVRHFFPMHFGLGDTSDEQMKYQLDAADVRNYANPSHGECICLQAPFSSFIMP